MESKVEEGNDSRQVWCIWPARQVGEDPPLSAGLKILRLCDVFANLLHPTGEPLHIVSGVHP
jgi:hypothetical protein